MLENIFTTMLNMSITASVAAVLIFFFRWILDNKVPKIFSYVLWFIVLVRMLIPFSFSSTFSIFNVVPVFETLVTQISQQYVIDQNMQYTADYQNISQEKANSIDSKVLNNNNNIDHLDFTPSQELSADPKHILTFIAARIWLAGMIALLLLSIFLYFYTSRRLNIAILYKNDHLFSESCQKLRLNRKVKFYTSDNVYTPVVYGLIKPCIILPTALEQNCNKSELQYIIEHELIHIRRLDYIIKPLWMFSLCIHWFNPILWLSFILFLKDMEMSCDERVIKANDNDIRSEYATLLIKLAVKQNTLINSKILAFGESNIKNRIKKIMSFRKPALWLNLAAIIFIIIFGVILLTNGQHNQINKKEVNKSNEYNAEVLLKYKNKYVGNASNVSNLIHNLPYADLYKGISLKTEKPPYGININYNLISTDVDTGKIENILLNNAVIMFALIDNVDIINFNLKIDNNEKNYQYTREKIQKRFDKDLREYAKDISSFEILLSSLNTKEEKTYIYNNEKSINVSSSSEKYSSAEAIQVVEQLGQKLKFVNKLIPEKELKEEITKYYSPYLSPSLLSKWLKDPKKAFGRYVSSPWPDRIEVKKVTKINNNKYIIEGDIVEITSVPEEEWRTKVIVTVEKFEKLGWLINDITSSEQNDQFQENVNIARIKLILDENQVFWNAIKPIYISNSKMINDIMSMIENSKPLLDTSKINKINKGTEYNNKIIIEYRNGKKREIKLIYDYLYEIGYLDENGKKKEPNYNFFRYINSLNEYPNPDTNIEQQVLNLFKKYNWTIDFKINTLKIDLPKNLKHKAGEYPIKIYWAYNNELSKQIKLDFSSYLGKAVTVEIYRLREPLPDFLKPRRDARGIIVKYNKKIIGAYIDAGRHDSFACSLDRKNLQEITHKDWNEWINNYIDYNDEIEKKLLKLKPEDIIKEYINALDRHDYKMVWACSTRKSLVELLSTNMDNRYLYNNESKIDYNIKKAKLIKIENIKNFSDEPGTLEYPAQIYFDFNKIITDNDGICIRFIILKKDTDKTGWKVDAVGTGP